MTYTPKSVVEHLHRWTYTAEFEECDFPKIVAFGSVLEIELRGQHFEAHVFAVEAPAPVAIEPVTLDLTLAKELTYNGPEGPAIDGWKVISITDGAIRRVERWHHMVIRNEATGCYYRGTYLCGMGDVEYPMPWEADEPVFEPVERQVKVIRKERWVTPTPPASPSVADAPAVAGE